MKKNWKTTLNALSIKKTKCHLNKENCWLSDGFAMLTKNTELQALIVKSWKTLKIKLVHLVEYWEIRLTWAFTKYN